MERDLNISINLPHPRISFSYKCLKPIPSRKGSVVVLEKAVGILRACNTIRQER
jgi:hypothetical protein